MYKKFLILIMCLYDTIIVIIKHLVTWYPFHSNMKKANNSEVLKIKPTWKLCKNISKKKYTKKVQKVQKALVIFGTQLNGCFV